MPFAGFSLGQVQMPQRKQKRIIARPFSKPREVDSSMPQWLRQSRLAVRCQHATCKTWTQTAWRSSAHTFASGCPTDLDSPCVMTRALEDCNDQAMTNGSGDSCKMLQASAESVVIQRIMPFFAVLHTTERDDVPAWHRAVPCQVRRCKIY